MKFQNETFTDADITLDYNEFTRCTFIGCTLHYFGGHWLITECEMRMVKFGLHDAADRTLSFLKMVHSSEHGPQILEELLKSASAPPPMKLN